MKPRVYFVAACFIVCLLSLSIASCSKAAYDLSQVDSDVYLIGTPSYQVIVEVTSGYYEEEIAEHNCECSKPAPDFSHADYDKYTIMTPLYQIIEEPSGYYYRIATSRKVFAEGVYYRELYIDDIETGIIRLFTSAGPNAHSVQYFDVWKDRTSERFAISSAYDDYAAENNTEECLIAYFDFPRSVLIVRDIFNEHGFSTEIDRGFISATCNRLVILNENEIYIDHHVFADGYSDDDLIAGNKAEFVRIREVVKFR